MKIDCISDLHGHRPQMEGGDLCIIAGDFTARHTKDEMWNFFRWADDLPYSKVILVPGNHDSFLIGASLRFGKLQLLINEAVIQNQIVIYGSPYTPAFPKVHPACSAFMFEEMTLSCLWAHIPPEVDILVTHGPPYGILDESVTGEKCGSPSLRGDLESGRIRPFYHIYGHIHEAYGHMQFPDGHALEQTHFINCSYVDEHYKPKNTPFVIEWEG